MPMCEYIVHRISLLHNAANTVYILDISAPNVEGCLDQLFIPCYKANQSLLLLVLLTCFTAVLECMAVLKTLAYIIVHSE